MADRREPPPHSFCAGDCVEVFDSTSRYDRRIGIVMFFVSDNVYVKLPALGRRITRMFFADQLRLAAGPRRLRVVARTSDVLRIIASSLDKTRH